MRRFFAISTVVFTLLLPLVTTAQQAYRVTGSVEIRDQQKQQSLPDQSFVAAWLTPVVGHNAEVTASAYQAHPYEMLQHGKHFEPHLLVIPVGSTVKFPNLDPWFHNVFSLYRGKRFDLGLYQAGSQKTVQFDRPGASYIFCNIHPQMSAVVLAVDSHLIGVSDSAGHISIPDVPPGHYRVHFWYEFVADASQLETREVTVGNGDATFGKLSIVAKPNRDERHKNKYGQDYDPENMTPEY
jgi:plastocyanin